MVELYKPPLEDLWFKETMLNDEKTMSYNNAYGGTIPFPREKWTSWYDRWMEFWLELRKGMSTTWCCF